MSKSDYFHGNNTQCYLRGSPCHPLQLPLKNLHKSPLSRGLESVQRTDYSRLKPLLFCSLSLSLPPFLSVLRPLRLLLLLQQLCSHTPLRVGRSFHSKKNAVSFPHHPTLFHAHTHTVACLKKEKAASDISFFCS